MKRAFAVGKCHRRMRRIVILEYLRAPIAGPFALHAVVSKTAN
jgi:hypothetical protein